MSFVAAFRFLTVIPLPFGRVASEREIERSLTYFPVVGLAIGLVLAAFYILLNAILPTSLVSAFVIVGMVLINGALHMDGFIDTFDGLAGNKTPEERWSVMKDSRVGAFGLVAGVLLLLLKYLSLSSIPRVLAPASLVIMPAIARWCMVYAITGYPYAKPSGLGTLFKHGASWRRFWIASALTVVISCFTLWLGGVAYFYVAGVVIIAAVWLVTFAWAHYLSHEFAGLTGDSYGAVSELAEVAVLVIVVMLTYNRWVGM